ncbi:MAG TPA: FHA domain-containing protein [Polyangiales bacterium]|nr:FHA domain-containing protein [Polyangiales bacterium]
MSTYWLKYRGTRFPVRRGETVVGRSPYCSIVLSNSQASRQHCALHLTGETLSVVDLNSANGTWVNHDRISGPHPLAAGDIIRVGTDVVEVLAAQSDRAERSRPTTHDRKAPAVESPRAKPAPYEDAPHTQTSASQLELVEALLTSGSETQQPMALAPMLQRAIEGLVHEHSDRSASSSPDMIARLTAVVEQLSSWAPDTLTPWRERVLATLKSDSTETGVPRANPYP